jgi:hypothetical protein
MVPRVAMLTTEGDMRFTIGASEGSGMSADAADCAADDGWDHEPRVANIRLSEATFIRELMRDPLIVWLKLHPWP